MARRTETIELGRNRYEIKQLGAHDARQMLFRLLKILGTGVVPAVRAESADVGMAIAAESIITSLDLAEVDLIFRKFAESTKLTYLGDNGVTSTVELHTVFDDHFADRLLDQFEWFSVCMKANYASFLGQIRDQRGAALFAKVSSLLQSQIPSSGQSTA